MTSTAVASWDRTIGDLADVVLASPPKRRAAGGEWDWYFDLTFGDQMAARRRMTPNGLGPDMLADYLGCDIDTACLRWLFSFREDRQVAAAIREYDDRPSDGYRDLSTTNGLAGPSEAHRYLGISRQRLHQLRAAGRFPAPFATLESGPIWTEAQLATYMAER